MAEVEYEIVSSDSELGDAPELGKKLLVIPKWRRKDGRATAFVMHELTTGEHDDFELSDRVFDTVGNVTRIKRGSKQYEWLARTTRDGDGNRVWQSAEDCEKRLKPLPKSITTQMILAADKINYGDASSADEATSSAEGNSEETQS